MPCPTAARWTVRTKVTEAPPTPGVVSRPPLAQIEVGDTGVGMSDDTRRRCFEPFFTTKGERGTGLGLAMVYGIVRRHNADIEIDSTVGKGTTVRLSFPTQAAGAAAPASVTDTAPPVPARLRLLIVDDDPLLIKSLRDTLEADGHAVTAATGGREGIEEFRRAYESRESFAAVITDLGMPYVSGPAGCRGDQKSLAADAGHSSHRLGPAHERRGRCAGAREPRSQQAAETPRAARGSCAVCPPP